jgi:hypothetical protein
MRRPIVSAQWLTRLSHPPTTKTGWWGCAITRFALGRGDVQLPLAGNSLQFVGATVLERDT